MSLTPIYLDYAAATPLEAQVAAAMQPYFAHNFANPSSLYRDGREARAALERARADVAQVLGAKPTEIMFTSGATESINLAVCGLARQYPGKRVVATTIEFQATLACLAALAREGHPAKLVPVSEGGLVSLPQLKSALDDDTVLISIGYANSEIGTIQPLKQIGLLVAQIREGRRRRGIELPLYLHTDAAAAANYLDLSVNRLGVDLLTLGAAKFYGPKVGVLYVRSGLALRPLLFGGGQEQGLRSGTENVAGAVGLAAALKLVQADRGQESRRLSTLRNDFVRQLQGPIPDLLINGDMSKRLPNNISVSLPGADGEALVMYLDAAGVAASTGAACSTGRQEPSHVIMALGRSRPEAQGSLRFTLGRSTTAADIDIVSKILPQIARRVRVLTAV